MFKRIIECFKTKEVRVKLIITLLLLLVFRIGCWLPIPGINSDAFQVVTDENSFLSLLSSINGGSLANGAFLALGVSPYISASIIIQLLSIAIPSWQRLSKEGEEGRKKISRYTRWAALILAVAQAIGIVVGYNSVIESNMLWDGSPQWLTSMLVVIVLVAGAMFTVWLGERITELAMGYHY